MFECSPHGVNAEQDNEHKAFSPYSLTQGAKQGYFALEEFKLLHFMDKYPDRKMLYNHEYPWSAAKTLAKHYQSLKDVEGELWACVRRTTTNERKIWD